MVGCSWAIWGSGVTITLGTGSSGSGGSENCVRSSAGEDVSVFNGLVDGELTIAVLRMFWVLLIFLLSNHFRNLSLSRFLLEGDFFLTLVVCSDGSGPEFGDFLLFSNFWRTF